jgi:hypothetical protein
MVSDNKLQYGLKTNQGNDFKKVIQIEFVKVRCENGEEYIIFCSVINKIYPTKKPPQNGEAF